MTIENLYDDHAAVDAAVADHRHREVIGGMWDEIGALQFDFLVATGLRTDQRLLDVGCGSLRGGLRFAAYLDPGNYWGIDLSQSLLDAGRSELEQAGLASRVPRDHLVQLDDFQFDQLAESFDVAVAVSVFSHLSFNRIRRCLARLAPAMATAGRFFATAFIVPDADPIDDDKTHLDGIITSPVADPFHYRIHDLAHAVAELPWSVDHVGEWGHPRGQQMVVFHRT